MNVVSPEFGVLQARVEAEICRPAVIAVTSAARRDGKTMVADGLARSLAFSSYRVLLVDGNQQKNLSENTRRVPKLSTAPDFDIFAYVSASAQGEPDLLDLNYSGVDKALKGDSSFTNEAARCAFARCRERYDYIIVDTSGALQSSVGLTFAAIADAVIVAVRLGRAPLAADRDLVATLRSIGAKLSGVVTTRRGAIATFAAKQRQVARTRITRVASYREEPSVNGGQARITVGSSK